MLISLAKVVIYTYFNAENSQPCERWEADTRHRENVGKITSFMLWDCEMTIFLNKQNIFKIWAIALKSMDKHKYKNFDKHMIKEISKTEYCSLNGFSLLFLSCMCLRCRWGLLGKCLNRNTYTVCFHHFSSASSTFFFFFCYPFCISDLWQLTQTNCLSHALNTDVMVLEEISCVNTYLFGRKIKRKHCWWWQLSFHQFKQQLITWSPEINSGIPVSAKLFIYCRNIFSTV